MLNKYFEHAKERRKFAIPSKALSKEETISLCKKLENASSDDGENFVEVTILTTTEKAHKIYGRL